MDIFDKVKPYTLLSRARIELNVNAVCDCVNRKVKGDIVEIGVYKGGSTLAMIHGLRYNGGLRDVHLYDTFCGMTEPSVFDVDRRGLDYTDKDKCDCTLDKVQDNIFSNTDYPRERIHFHVGDIRETDVSLIPESIAVLRLDTDFYDSTKFELENFYSKVTPGGYIIIDDYGHWKGARKAVDEFIPTLTGPIVLHQIDYTGVYWIKEDM